MMVVGRWRGGESRRHNRGRWIWTRWIVAAAVAGSLAGCAHDSTTPISVGVVGDTGAVDGAAGPTGDIVGAGDTQTGTNPDSGSTGSTATGSTPQTGGSGASLAPGSSAAPGSDGAPAEAGANPVSTGGIAWQGIGDGLEGGRLDVPVNYDDPTGAKFSLYLVRHRATDSAARIGTLLVNPGGPGFPGTVLAKNARSYFDPEIVARFDIVGWDPRGAGATTPAVDCIDDYDRFFTAVDHTPDDEAEHQLIIDLAKEFAAGCAERTGPVLGYVGTNNSARDIDQIREALDEDAISYFGSSYGSELGAVWITLFPDTVRAAVLDGASDPNADHRTKTEQQLEGFEAALERFFARCRSQRCAFSGDRDPQQVYLDLMLALDAKPIGAAAGRPPVGRDVARMAVFEAMYDEGSWNHLDLSLQAAQKGDGSGLLALYDSYFGRRKNGSYPNHLEAYQAITCADTPDRESVADTDAFEAKMAVAAPLLVPSGTIEYECNFFDDAIDPRTEITGGQTDAPVMVIGTTGDAVTPLASSQKMAATIPGAALLTLDADRHTGYGANDCVVDAVNELLINLSPSANGATC